MLCFEGEPVLLTRAAQIRSETMSWNAKRFQYSLDELTHVLAFDLNVAPRCFYTPLANSIQ